VGGEPSWRKLTDFLQRRQVMFELAGRICDFRAHFNDGSLPFIVPVIQSVVDEEDAVELIQHGFEVEVTDGRYGKGIYFAGDVAHATANRERPSSETVGGTEVVMFLLSLALPGKNVYPVTEHSDSILSLKGQGCRAGHQSHFVVVDRKTGHPASLEQLQGGQEGEKEEKTDWQRRRRQRIESRRGERGWPETAEELVIFEPSQALPLFLVTCKIDHHWVPFGARGVMGREATGRSERRDSRVSELGGEVRQPPRLVDLLTTPANL